MCDKSTAFMKCACASCAAVRGALLMANAVDAVRELVESLFGSLDPGSPPAEAAVGFLLTLIDDVVTKARAEEDDSASRS